MQVLVVPLPSAESHTFVMVKVVQELAARGHQVLVRSLDVSEILESLGLSNLVEVT